MNSVLSGRLKSSIGISLPTDLALESLFEGPNPCYDSDRVIPNHVNIKLYDNLLINVETLIRNMVSSISTSERINIRLDDTVYCILSELSFISGHLEVASEGKCNLVAYKFDPEYEKNKNYKYAKFRTSTTEATKYVDSLIREASEILVRQSDHEVTLFKNKISLKSARRTLMLTHHTVDLVSFGRYDDLYLLESNTGVLKDRGLFYTKLFNGKTLKSLPLNSLTLQVYGDNNTFRPQSHVLREIVSDLSDRRRWNPVTTDDKVRNDLRTLGAGDTRDMLLSMI